MAFLSWQSRETCRCRRRDGFERIAGCRRIARREAKCRRYLRERRLDLGQSRLRLCLTEEKILRVFEDASCKRPKTGIEGFTRGVVFADLLFQGVPAPDANEHLVAFGAKPGGDDPRKLMHLAVVRCRGDNEVFAQRGLELDRLLDLCPNLLLR